MAKELKLYLPIIYRDIIEYEALSSAETPFLEDLEVKTEQVVADSFLSTMSDERLREWEVALGITPTTNSMEQRRSTVLAKFRGTGKLSGTLIKAIVSAFTGGTARVSFADGILKVSVAPPSSTFADFNIDSLTEELSLRKPAHLSLVVELAYITWEQLKNSFSSWQEVYNTFGSWDDVYKYYVK